MYATSGGVLKELNGIGEAYNRIAPRSRACTQLPTQDSCGSIRRNPEAPICCFIAVERQLSGGFRQTPETSASDKAYINRATEASIHVGLAVLLAIACLTR
jgi:hypothetical protein